MGTRWPSKEHVSPCVRPRCKGKLKGPPQPFRRKFCQVGPARVQEASRLAGPPGQGAGTRLPVREVLLTCIIRAPPTSAPRAQTPRGGLITGNSFSGFRLSLRIFKMLKAQKMTP